MTQNDCFRYLNIGLPQDILQRKLHGDFAGAVRLIDKRLANPATPDELRYCLTAEREMILRLPDDFPFTKGDALSVIRSHIPDFTEEELDERIDAGKINWIYADGEMRIFDRFFESMCKSEPAFAFRAGVNGHGVESARKGSSADLRLERVRHIMQEKGKMSCRIRIRASVRVNDDIFTPGMFVRAHLPLPADCEQQSDIRIEALYPEDGIISPGNSLQRTVCWEENMSENHEFMVEYSYINTAKYHDTDTLTPAPVQPDFSTEEEAPHIVFSPTIRALAEKLSEGTDNPLEKARRFYDYITLNFKYNFMPSYFSLERIPDNCALSHTGDCGVFALLFLTLCRFSGIPAQWQSGLTAEPDFIGGHDWVRFYIAPYGWLYADTSYGIGAVRAEQEERRRFYFGNLDPYRMIANRAFQKPFTIQKSYWRTDPYDNQLGEIETDSRGLKYQEFSRKKEILSHEEVNT